MYRTTRNTLIPTGRKLLTLAIASLMTSYTLAQSTSDFDATAVDTSAEFNKLDSNQDNVVEWSDIQEGMEPRLKAVNLDARATFDQYDNDGDNALDKEEFEGFILSVRETEYQQDSFATDQESSQQSAAAAGYIDTDNDEEAASSAETSYGATDAEGTAGSSTATTNRSTVNSAAGGEFATEESISERDELSREDNGTGSRPGNPAVHSAAGGEFRAGSGATANDEMTSVDQPSSRDPYTEGGNTDMEERPTSYQSGSDDNNSNRSAVQAEPIGQAEFSSQIPQDLTNRSIDSLTDRKMRNANGDKIGNVAEVVVSRNGEVGLVVASGGLLGIGERKFVAPVEELSLIGSELVWNTSQSKKDLRDSHAYQEDDFEVITEQYEKLGELQPGGMSRR